MVEKRITLSVDGIIVFPSKNNGNKFILIKRKYPPFQNYLALPGGYVEYGEKTEEAVIREIKEETGLDVQIQGLIGVYSDSNRDPRGHCVSISYICFAIGGNIKAGDDAKDAIKVEFTEDNIEQMSSQIAFDHKKIIIDAIKWFNNRITT